LLWFYVEVFDLAGNIALLKSQKHRVREALTCLDNSVVLDLAGHIVLFKKRTKNISSARLQFVVITVLLLVP
jgi:hypothetical protein